MNIPCLASRRGRDLNQISPGMSENSARFLVLDRRFGQAFGREFSTNATGFIGHGSVSFNFMEALSLKSSIFEASRLD